MSDIARQEGTDFSYVARHINLTLLAPEITEAILDESVPDYVRLRDLEINPPVLWEEQVAWFESMRRVKPPRGRSEGRRER